MFAPGSAGAGSVSPNGSSFGAIRIGKGAHLTLPKPFSDAVPLSNPFGVEDCLKRNFDTRSISHVEKFYSVTGALSVSDWEMGGLRLWGIRGRGTGAR